MRKSAKEEGAEAIEAEAVENASTMEGEAAHGTAMGPSGSAVKLGIVNSLRGIDAIEGEIVALVRNTVSGALRAGGDMALGAVEVTRDVAKGAILAGEEVGVGLTLSVKSVAKGIILGVSDVGGDVVKVAAVTATAAIEAAGQVGNTAVATAKDVLLNTVGSIKDVVSAILPKAPRQPAPQAQIAATQAE